MSEPNQTGTFNNVGKGGSILELVGFDIQLVLAKTKHVILHNARTGYYILPDLADFLYNAKTGYNILLDLADFLYNVRTGYDILLDLAKTKGDFIFNTKIEGFYIPLVLVKVDKGFSYTI